MNSKDFKVQKIPNDKEHYYIANEDGVLVLKNGNVSMSFFHCYWESRKEAEIFLAGWQVLNPPPPVNLNQVDQKPEYELGTKHIQYINGIRVVHKYCKLTEYRWLVSYKIIERKNYGI